MKDISTDALAPNAELSKRIRAGEDDDGKMLVLAMANRVCQHLPDGWELRLCMERGAAWVTLHNPDGDCPELPDAADKSLEQQVNDALCVALGW